MSPRLYVVGFPELAPADAQLLQQLRVRYYPTQADRIGPHVTFAFALPPEAEDALAAQVDAVAATTAPIAFTLRKVTPIADAASGRAYITLVPHRGHLAMIDLHRRLHDGPLERYREPAIRFEPHLTVGMFESADESVAGIADRIAAEIRDAGAAEGIAGRIAALTIVAEAAGAVTERRHVGLRAG
ncbi:2'-5' RNA ligase family protein [Vineibacter terrae]|uniref:2'-5' RNA ligase family protein n=1 Tax=Vineibacter terrae TaxID=2586908 RepID=UPI002E37FEE4|nr:2'-5' RNA ligase family protein [Vineibacter terrae]HEX2888212.1 2'-5' RNA ligase family protein [Vineibacter terrae]